MSDSKTSLPAPPTRSGTTTPSSSRTAEPAAPGWKGKMKTWGKVGVDKAVIVSDWAGHKMNAVADKAGSEHFYPTTGDFPQEMEKCARILRAFTVEGVETTIPDDKASGPADKKKQKKVLRKIPPQIIKDACGLAIFTSFRTGIAPFGGAGGAGIVIARLPDGSWSGPSCMSPNNLSTGFMLGIDIYDAILVIRTPEALKSFGTHKATLGTDVGVAAGPFGAGAAAEVGLERAPVLSYVRSRGLYAGVQLVGQIFVDRFDENAAMYHWPGIKAGDILSGKVRVPHEARSLHAALLAAESGAAQRAQGDSLDVFLTPTIPDELDLRDGEVLHLPPTPTQIEADEKSRGREKSLEMSPEEVEELKKRLGGLAVSSGGDGAYSPRSSTGLPPPPQRGGGGGTSGPVLPVRRNLPPRLGESPVGSGSRSPVKGVSPRGSPRTSIDRTRSPHRAVPPLPSTAATVAPVEAVVPSGMVVMGEPELVFDAAAAVPPPPPGYEEVALEGERSGEVREEGRRQEEKIL